MTRGSGKGTAKQTTGASHRDEGEGTCVLRDFLGFMSFLSFLTEGAEKKLGTESRLLFSCMHVKAGVTLVHCHSKEVGKRFGNFISHLLKDRA